MSSPGVSHHCFLAKRWIWKDVCILKYISIKNREWKNRCRDLSKHEKAGTVKSCRLTVIYVVQTKCLVTSPGTVYAFRKRTVDAGRSLHTDPRAVFRAVLAINQHAVGDHRKAVVNGACVSHKIVKGHVFIELHRAVNDNPAKRLILVAQNIKETIIPRTFEIEIEVLPEPEQGVIVIIRPGKQHRVVVSRIVVRHQDINPEKRRPLYDRIGSRAFRRTSCLKHLSAADKIGGADRISKTVFANARENVRVVAKPVPV